MLARDLVHMECPEDAGDAEEDLALSDPHARAYAASASGRELQLIS